MPPPRNWLAELPPNETQGTNLRAVSQAAALGVACSACGRRAALDPEVLGAHEGNMQEIRSLRLSCRGRGSREWTYKLLQTVESAAAFMAGAF